MIPMTFSDIERLQSITTEADDSLQMNPDTFRVLYEATARPLWVFLWRRTGDTQLADDLLQETFYRFLRARTNHESDAHRRNYLFRIAANLATDSHRRKTPTVPLPEKVRSLQIIRRRETPAYKAGTARTCIEPWSAFRNVSAMHCGLLTPKVPHIRKSLLSLE